MTLTLLYPPGPLYAYYREVEAALGVAQQMHERQMALKAVHPDFYDPEVHAMVLAFNLRMVGRKMDALISSFRACIPSAHRDSVSPQTARLQAALQQYNAALAACDARDTPVEISLNVLEMAFACLASIEQDVQYVERRY